MQVMTTMLKLAWILLGTIICCCSLPMLSARAQTKEFCAKPWAALTPGDKKTLDDITSAIISERGRVGTPIKLWDTRTIPYYVDSHISANLIVTIKKATKILADRTLIRFVKCNKEVAQEKDVKGFVYIGRFEDIPCDPGSAACNKGMGMKAKGALSSLPGDHNVPRNSEKDIMKNGALIGLKESNGEYKIVHELIHRLGFAHQQQSPYAGESFKKIDRSDRQCATITNEYSHVYWIPYYDPASVMHYGLGSCGKMELDCKVGAQRAAGRWTLDYCKVDEVIKAGTPCLYASPGVTGDQCFRRPAELVGGSQYSDPRVRYSDNDFGQEQCLSMLDQALILSRYFPVEKDNYHIDDLITQGVCEAD